MKIIVAPDSFKGSLTALEAAKAIEKGVKQVIPDANISLMPLSDGGEGFVEAMVSAMDGRWVEVGVHDPLGRTVQAKYGLIDNDRTAVIETAAASGITLVQEEERNPLYSSTYGTGELIRHALDNGCQNIYLGLGGSATNDGGIGMAQALGYTFYNEAGNRIEIFHSGLENVKSIDASNKHPRLAEITFIAACDVDTYLYGEQGATAVFGPQKGVLPEQVPILNNVLETLADAIQQDLEYDVHQLSGGGAAGGLGAGVAAFCGAELQSGIDMILQATQFSAQVKDADLVITGEGKTDEQTNMGKVPSGVGQVSKQFEVPVICLSGSLGDGYQEVKQSGVQALFSVIPQPATLDDALSEAEGWLTDAACELISLWQAAYTSFSKRK